jgi:predicted RNA-binding Zn-ribbon protein involved in translation (DUF1610 family)
MIVKKGKNYTCPLCGANFNSLNAEKVCSNCFACTGCEIFICPTCGQEAIIKDLKRPEKRSQLG